MIEDEVVLQIICDIRQICPRIGTRKLQYMLLQEYGIAYGRDRLFELLERENLLVRQRHRKPRTTWSGHIFPVYPNLVADLIPSRPNEVWVSDITYIRTEDGFQYLFLITDMYSRKIVGWELAKDLGTEHALVALEQAIAQKKDDNPTIHHSDRGTQYCCAAYVGRLKNAGIHISMTEKGDPRENAYAERVNGTIKNEFLKPINPTQATLRIAVAIAINNYNSKRPHLSLGNLTPDIAHTMTGPIKRHWKHYPWYSKDNSKK